MCASSPRNNIYLYAVRHILFYRMTRSEISGTLAAVSRLQRDETPLMRRLACSIKMKF
jgi:hypothetical protein